MQGVVDKWTSLYAATSEKHDAAAFAAIAEGSRISARGIEVGHIFYFGTKYSVPMKAVVNGPDGKEHPVHMGSYGIGPSRLAAALIEANHDEAGMIWPEARRAVRRRRHQSEGRRRRPATAPARESSPRSARRASTTLYDDRDERPGAKFATMDLIGLPQQVIVGPEGPRRGQGRGQGPPQRRARDSSASTPRSRGCGGHAREGAAITLRRAAGRGARLSDRSPRLGIPRAAKRRRAAGPATRPVLRLRMDGRAALSARAARAGLDLGDRRLFVRSASCSASPR